MAHKWGTLGTLLTVVGGLCTLLNGLIAVKRQDETIEKEVQKALAMAKKS